MEDENKINEDSSINNKGEVAEVDTMKKDSVKTDSKAGFRISKLKAFQIATAVLAVLLVAVLALGINGSLSGFMFMDKNAVAEKTVDYLNENFGTTATVKSVEEKSGVYALTLDIQGQETDIYVTKDGEIIFPLAIDKNAEKEEAVPEEPAAAAEMKKSDKPTVELFVMSHCPYGTQMEKGILPVVKLLGDKIDFKVKFVYYAMHPNQGEVQEELTQYCIQKEMNDRYLDYLSCFLKDGNTTACLASAKIDTKVLEKCVNETDAKYNVTNLLNDKSTWLSGRFPRVNLDLADNEKYKIGGSPTLIINGVEASSGRDSASILKAICSAFTTEPGECSTNLSSAAPAPGFGYEGTGSNSAATCG